MHWREFNQVRILEQDCWRERDDSQRAYLASAMIGCLPFVLECPILRVWVADHFLMKLGQGDDAER